MALPRPLFVLLLGVALGAPFVLIARAGHALVSPLAEASVGLLLQISAPLSVARVEPEPVPTVVGEESEIELAQGRGTKSRSQPRPAAVKRAPAALFVGRNTVLRLSQSGARPSGRFVDGTAAHPAGLQLSGVSGLGIGVQDGDVLIEALGISPRSPGEIVGAIIEARAKRVEALGGTLWRKGQTFRITVEQPY